MQTGSSGGESAVAAARVRHQSRFWLTHFYGAAIGKKAVMAVTGIVLIGFLLVHMIGNLKLYFPNAEFHLNTYSEWLRTVGEPVLPRTGLLWIVRTVLILSFIFHIHSAATLTMMNRRARPIPYKGGRSYATADYAARTMRWSAIIIALFLVWHLLDLTWGWHVVHKDFVAGQPYRNIWHSFAPERWPVSVIYIIANLLLGLHIYHGAWSLFQSLGLANPRFNSWRRGIAGTIAAVIVIGNVSFPIAVLSGMIKEPVDPVPATTALTHNSQPDTVQALTAITGMAKGI